MFLRKINLVNFKNHETRQFSFEKRINCIIGNNGTGKTNLLDAIYYLCLTKSYFNSIDQQNILFDRDFFRLEGEFEKEQAKYHLVYKLPAGKKKEVIINDTPLTRLSDHIGNFPAIIISPDDSQLIMGSSEERRKFIDTTISQVNHDYLNQLILYNKILAQRNAALKKFAETRRTDRTLIESYNQQLVPLGIKIHEARKIVTEKLSPMFQTFYQQVSLEREKTRFVYISQLNEKPFDELLKDNFERDLMLQRTDGGIHKDELEFYIGANKLKKFGSQGQQKSFIIAIKFAQYHFIKVNKNFAPVLLIDDIFDKLDQDRSRKLVELIAGDEFEQVFITDTDEKHISEALYDKEELFSIIRF